MTETRSEAVPMVLVCVLGCLKIAPQQQEFPCLYDFLLLRPPDRLISGPHSRMENF